MSVGTLHSLLRKISIVSIILLAILTTGCGKLDVKSFSYNGFYFDTIVTLTVYDKDDDCISHGFMEECGKYEKIFSTTDEESELFKLNKLSAELSKENRNVESYEISKDLYECIKEADEFAEATDGAYDITIRPVSKLWNFSSGENKVPDDDKISEALHKVDHKSVDLSEKDGKFYISFNLVGTEIELGSAAKGYIGDRLIEYLKTRGISSAILSLGGNVQCLGTKTDENGENKGFNVAIKDPFDKEKIFEVMNVRNKAVVTSGVYERCFEKDGKLYHHILDPKNGFPVNSEIVSVTVITEKGSKADILSTVCFIEGYEKSRELLKSENDITVKFIYSDGSVKQIG